MAGSTRFIASARGTTGIERESVRYDAEGGRVPRGAQRRTPAEIDADILRAKYSDAVTAWGIGRRQRQPWTP